MKAIKQQIRYKPSENWYEGVPVGNGIVGGILYGKAKIILALDNVCFWDERALEETQSKYFTYAYLKSAVQEIKNGTTPAHYRVFEDGYNHSYPTKIACGRFILGGVCCDYILDRNYGAAIVNGRNDTFEIFCAENVPVIVCNGVTEFIYERPEYYVALGYKQVAVQTTCDFTEAYSTADGFIAVFAVRHDNAIFIGSCKANDLETLTAELNLYEKQVRGMTVAEEREKTRGRWQKYWAQSSIIVPDEAMTELYRQSDYLFGACSGEMGYPIALQGLWTADDGGLPPWKGDYHFDINVQMTYWHALRANRMQEGRVLCDWLWNGRERFREFAGRFYGVDGLLIPAVCTHNGMPLGGWPQYSLSPVMTIWAAQAFEHYYNYSGDEVFLRERAMPFFEMVEHAIRGLLTKRNNGYLVLPLSTSPEYKDNTAESWLDEPSNNDIALLRYLYSALIRFCGALSLDATEYTVKLSKIPPLSLGKNGELLLAKDLVNTESHRHLSHLMAIYPLKLLDFDKPCDKSIILQSIRDCDIKGYGWFLGWSYVWLASITSVADMGNKSYFLLDTFTKYFVGANGFHLNGDYKNYGVSAYHYHPFTLEGNFGFANALQEMLVQDRNGYVELLAAIPDSWRDGKIEFSNLRVSGGGSIDMEKHGRRLTVTVRSSAKPIRLLNPFAKVKECENGCMIQGEYITVPPHTEVSVTGMSK